MLAILMSCCTIALNHNKVSPEYKGVDPRAKTIVDEYMALAKLRGLEFDNPVTVGFKSINDDRTIGVCTYGGSFREIDIDIGFWNRATSMGKLTLLFHELSHCACDRAHDYGDGKPYGDDTRDRNDSNKKDGFFKDKCPISIMFPILVTEDCMRAHYSEYIEEMFNRCEEW